MSVLKLIILSVRRNRACATVDICMDHSFRERERKRARERVRLILYNFPVFIFKYVDIVQQNSANILIAYFLEVITNAIFF